jgi:hypothetical protein
MKKTALFGYALHIPVAAKKGTAIMFLRCIHYFLHIQESNKPYKSSSILFVLVSAFMVHPLADITSFIAFWL